MPGFVSDPLSLLIEECLKNPRKDTPNLVERLSRRAEAVTASKGVGQHHL